MICRYEGCVERGNLKGLCKKHYYRHRFDNEPGYAERQRDLARVCRYGVTREDFENLLAAQGGRCGICGTDDPGRTWCVDHDHSCCPTKAKSCGKCVRGILCFVCNVHLGWFENNSPSVDLYLEKHACGRSFSDTRSSGTVSTT